MSEPQCIEISCSASSGGKVALIKYGNLTGDFSFFASRRYSIPDGWTEEQVAKFQREKTAELYAEVEVPAQAEADS